MGKTDYTVARQVEVSFEEKKSLFLCNIKSIVDEKEAQEFVAQIKQKYKDATHNVYAYITNNGISMRYSDDGEPQGTAGPPVLEVLKREELNDVVAVVTRYFGGVLLGAGGLIRAYAGSCKQGIDEAGKVIRAGACVLTLVCDYDKYGKLNNHFQHQNVLMLENEFMENVTMRIMCLDKDCEAIKAELVEMMNGAEVITEISKTTCFVDNEGKIMEVSL